MCACMHRHIFLSYFLSGNRSEFRCQVLFPIFPFIYYILYCYKGGGGYVYQSATGSIPLPHPCITQDLLIYTTCTTCILPIFRMLMMNRKMIAKLEVVLNLLPKYQQKILSYSLQLLRKVRVKSLNLFHLLLLYSPPALLLRLLVVRLLAVPTSNKK